MHAYAAFLQVFQFIAIAALISGVVLMAGFTTVMLIDNPIKKKEKYMGKHRAPKAKFTAEEFFTQVNDTLFAWKVMAETSYAGLKTFLSEQTPRFRREQERKLVTFWDGVLEDFRAEAGTLCTTNAFA